MSESQEQIDITTALLNTEIQTGRTIPRIFSISGDSSFADFLSVAATRLHRNYGTHEPFPKIDIQLREDASNRTFHNMRNIMRIHGRTP